MAPRISKATETILEQFNFEFAKPPEKDLTRISKYDEMWKAARTVCLAHPGQTLRVREYNTGASAYNDAKSINNGEHRVFKDGKDSWTAVAGKQMDDSGNVVLSEKGDPKFDIYLTYNGNETP